MHGTINEKENKWENDENHTKNFCSQSPHMNNIF